MTQLDLAQAGTNGTETATLLLIALGGPIALAAYLLPTWIAGMRHHHQTGAIAVINIFLGWLVIGWVVAPAMALSAKQKHPGIEQHHSPPAGR